MIITNIEEIDFISENQTVYDIETEHGTFIAGGKLGIMCKNTDSCYIKFPHIIKDEYESEEEYLKDIFKKSQECADFISSQFKKPIKLEFEKVMYPFFLVTKKRYAYKEWKSPTKSSGIQFKGLQTKRRDTCKYVRNVLIHLFEIVMNAPNERIGIENSKKYAKEAIENLLFDKIDYNELVLSKQLKGSYTVRENKTVEDCHWTNPKIKLPHVRLAQQIKEKDPVNHPKPPDRVPFLFFQTKAQKGKDDLQCDKVIHPDDLGNKKVDSLYYFQHQLEAVIKMFFNVLKIDPEKQIYGSLVIKKINQINGQNDLSKFLKKSGDTNDSNGDKKFVFKNQELDFIEELDEEEEE